MYKRQTQVNFNASLGYKKVSKLVKTMSPYDYAYYQYELGSTCLLYTSSISANTALKANFEKINNYALDYMVEGGAKDYMVSATPADVYKRQY